MSAGVLVCVAALVAVSGAAGREIDIDLSAAGVETANQSVNHTTSWICHVNKKYGIGGGIDHDLCRASCSNSTGDSKEYVGYIGAIVAVLLFGSNFVPVKKYNTGDGMFFQWVVCIGMWLVGLVVNFILDSPIFFLPAVMGGVFWATGNALVVPIIKMIGLTMGVTIWGVSYMLSGWIIGRFILHEDVSCSGLNYGGVGIVVLSVIMMAFVKSEGKKSFSSVKIRKTTEEESTPLLSTLSKKVCGCCPKLFQRPQIPTVKESLVASINSDKPTFSTNSPIGEGTIAKPVADADDSWIDKLGVWQKRIIGFTLSLVAGPLYSLIFLPVQYMKLCDEGLHSCTDMNYIFGVYSGILFTSTFYFFVYSAVTLNKPKVYPSVIFPGLIAGIMRGTAMVGFFLANQHLSLVITFPLVTGGPGFVSAAWGILLFKEIKGWKYILFFFVSFFVSICGIVLNGLSKCTVTC